MRNIENISNVDEIRKEIENQDFCFNIFNFYLSNIGISEVLNSGFGVITRKQSFFCYNYGKHEYLAEKIYDVLYDDFYDIYCNNNFDYRQTSIDYGDICIQLISKYYSLIWMPFEINKYQLSKLFELYDNIIRINRVLEENGEKKIIFGACAKDGENVKMFNFIDDFTSIIGMVCDKIKLRDDYVVVDRNISETKRFTLRQKISL